MDIQQYQQQLQQRRQQLESTRASIESARQRELSQRELRQPTGTALQQRELIRTSQRTFEQEKAKQLGLVGGELQTQVQLEKEFAPVIKQYEETKAQIASEQSYIEQFERGRKVAERDKPPWAGMTKAEREGWGAGREQFESYRERKKQLTELTNKLQGTGISLKQYILPTFDLSKLSEAQQQKFVERGLAQWQTTTPTSTQIDTSNLQKKSFQVPSIVQKVAKYFQRGILSPGLITPTSPATEIVERIKYGVKKEPTKIKELIISKAGEAEIMKPWRTPRIEEAVDYGEKKFMIPSNLTGTDSGFIIKGKEVGVLSGESLLSTNIAPITKQGILSQSKSNLSWYEKLDKSFGGILPGGIPFKKEVKQTGQPIVTVEEANKMTSTPEGYKQFAKYGMYAAGGTIGKLPAEITSSLGNEEFIREDKAKMEYESKLAEKGLIIVPNTIVTDSNFYASINPYSRGGIWGGIWEGEGSEKKQPSINKPRFTGSAISSPTNNTITSTGVPVLTQEEISKMSMEDLAKLSKQAGGFSYSAIPSNIPAGALTSSEFGGEVTYTTNEGKNVTIYGTKRSVEEILQEQVNLYSGKVEEKKPTFLEKIGGGIVTGGKAALGVSIGLGERIIGGWEKVLTPPAKAVITPTYKFVRNVAGEVGSIPMIGVPALNKGKVVLSSVGEQVQKVQQGISNLGKFAGEGARLSSQPSLIEMGIGKLTKRPDLFGAVSRSQAEARARVTKFGVESIPYIVAPGLALGADVISAGTTYKNRNEIINQELSQQYKEYEKTAVPEGQIKLTKQEWIEQARPQLEKQIEQGTALQTIVAGGILGGMGIVKGTKYAFAQREIFRGGGWTGVEGQRGYVQLEGYPNGYIAQKGETIFGRQTSILEPYITKESSRFMQWIGEPAVTKIISPARGYVSEIIKIPKLNEAIFPTIEKDILSKIYFTREYKIGKGGIGKIETKIGTVGGGEVSTTDILTKGTQEEKSMLGALFNKIIPETNVDISISRIVGKKGSEFTANILKKIPTEKVGNWIVSEVKQVSKNINVPRIGKGFEETTFTKFYKYIAPEESGVKVIKNLGGMKIPLEVTFGAGQKVIQEVTPIVSRIKIPKVTIPKVGISSISKQAENLPFMVGGTGLKLPILGGAALYQRTTGGQIPGTAPTGVIRGFPKEEIKVTEIPANVLTLKPQVDYYTPEAVTEVPVERTGGGSATTTPKLEEAQIVIPAIIPIQETQQIQTPIQRPRTQPSQPLMTGGGGTITGGAISFGGSPRRARKQIITNEMFEAFVKKKGKDISLGEFFTLGEAKGKLIGQLRSTLSASGFITKGGKVLKSNQLGLYNFEFAPSKKEEFRIIERKEKRLRRGTTSKDIQIFRRNAKRFKSKNIFNI